jgi:hypothetical protein
MRQQRPALSGPWHVAWHVVLVLGGWGVFGGFWWLVLQQKSYPFAAIAWLLAGALVVLPLTTLYWVLHNRRIYARKGPRLQVQVVAAAYARDWAGRPVYAEFDALKSAPLITIASTADEKRFSTLPDAPPPHPAGQPHAQPVAA